MFEGRPVGCAKAGQFVVFNQQLSQFGEDAVAQAGEIVIAFIIGLFTENECFELGNTSEVHSFQVVPGSPQILDVGVVGDI